MLQCCNWVHLFWVQDQDQVLEQLSPRPRWSSQQLSPSPSLRLSPQQMRPRPRPSPQIDIFFSHNLLPKHDQNYKSITIFIFMCPKIVFLRVLDSLRVETESLTLSLRPRPFKNHNCKEIRLTVSILHVWILWQGHVKDLLFLSFSSCEFLKSKLYPSFLFRWQAIFGHDA